MARLASIEEARAVLVHMAQSWFRLAEEQDDESANVLPLAPEESRPVVQQQQQVQPEDKDKKV
jgi:hypothetical protein